MKRIFLFLIVAIISLFLLIKFFFLSARESGEGIVIVSVNPVIQKNMTMQIETIGNVQAYASVEIRSMITGPLVKIGFKEGDIVKRGQMLFTLDQRPLIAAVNQANANLMRDQALFTKESVTLERNKKLVTQGYTSKQDFDTLIANAKSTQATVKADEAALENAKLQLEYATITAPISGKTGNITFKMGSVIKANDTLPLVTINQINPIYITFNLPQSKLTKLQDTLQKNPQLMIKAKITNKQSENGKLTFINNTIDIATGSIELKAEFENNHNLLWPGQYVTVEIPLEFIPQAILIPNLALVTGQKGFFVYVVDDASKVSRREVIPGETVGDQVIIKQGLKAGEKVITAGQLRIREGMKVSVQTVKE